jgi:hypothetical protein
MADYFAVLQRTLSGFSDPKPELRTKLYERARTTIARQLENRTPAVTGDALAAELAKLEKAIGDIERKYNPDYREPESAAPESGETDPAASAGSPDDIDALSEVAEESPLQEDTQAGQAYEEAQLAEPDSPTYSETLEQTSSATAEPAIAEQKTVGAPQEQPELEMPDPYSSVASEAEQVGTEVSEPPIDQSVNDAAVDQWSQEFLSQQPGTDPSPEPSPLLTATPIPIPILSHGNEPASGAEQDKPAPDAADDLSSQRAKPLPPAAEFDVPLDSAVDDTLVIPPAPGFGSGGNNKSKSRGFLKWLVILLLLAILGAVGAYGWMNKELVLEKTGMSDFLDDPVRPKPVKTISITPEPEVTVQPEPARKVESRLNEDGREVQDTAGDQAPTPTLQPTLEVPVEQQPNSGVPPVAQNAILYEEGATVAENTVDAGRVVWSVVQETPASGAAPEPAIRGRIEIPDRDAVLIMTIKRNTDKALPASHLIELVFAVPDDFSGGAIGQISRFVLKQSEQGRGEGLIGVPARIADGIFLIALNNLEQATLKNENLLKTRDWIDIPMQYRTGRRALMTIEKGLPGAKVFEEVFGVWDKL